MTGCSPEALVRKGMSQAFDARSRRYSITTTVLVRTNHDVEDNLKY
jgi:hypothetical protein